MAIITEDGSGPEPERIEYNTSKGLAVPLLVASVVQFLIAVALGRPPIDFAVLLGYSVGQALLPWLIFHFAVGRYRTPSSGWISFVALWAVALTTNLTVAQWRAEGDRNA